MPVTGSENRKVETLPLGDLTIIDATASLSGSYASRLLGDVGATVLRVEGAIALQKHPLTLETSLWDKGLEQIVHLGKHFVPDADLSTLEGRDGLRECLRTADVLIEDVGLLDEAFPWEEIQTLNPALLVVSLSPFGSSGPYASRPASDLSLWAQSGFAWTTPGMPDTLGNREEEPPLAPTGISIASLSGGTTAFVATLAALAYNDGQGRHVEVTELEALVAFNYHLINMYEYTRRKDDRGPILHGPNCLLPCKDGWIVLVATLQDHWEKLMDVMGNPDWAPAFPDAPALAPLYEQQQALETRVDELRRLRDGTAPAQYEQELELLLVELALKLLVDEVGEQELERLMQRCLDARFWDEPV